MNTVKKELLLKEIAKFFFLKAHWHVANLVTKRFGFWLLYKSWSISASGSLYVNWKAAAYAIHALYCSLHSHQHSPVLHSQGNSQPHLKVLYSCPLVGIDSALLISSICVGVRDR